MAFDAGAAVGRVILDDSKYKKGAEGVEKSNKSMTKSFITAQAILAATTKVLQESVKVVKESIAKATDFAESQSKLNTVFRDVKKEAKSLTNELVKGFGLSRKEAVELTGATGDLLSGFGFTQETALELSGDVQRLAVDLASFSNFAGGAKGASEALTKALLGETESAKALGIVIRQTDVDSRLAAEGKDKLTGQALLQAQAEARLQIAIEQSQNAIGDYARTQDSLANRQRTLQARTEDLQVFLGSLFIPIMNEMTGSTLNMVESINQFLAQESNMNKIITVISNLAAGIGVARDIIKEMGIMVKEFFLGILEDIQESFGDLVKGVDSGLDPFIALQGILKLLAIGFQVVGKQIETVIEANADLIRAILASGDTIATFFKFLVKKEPWENVKEKAKGAVNAFKNFGKNLFENTKELVTNTIDAFKQFPEEVTSSADDMRKKWNKTNERMTKEIKKQMEELVEGARDTGKDLGDIPGDEIVPGWQKAFDKIRQMGMKFKEGFDNVGKGIIENFSHVADALAGIFNDIFGLVTQQMNNELEALKAKNEKELEELEAQKEKKLELNQTGFEEQREQLEEQREQGLISQEEFDTKLIELEKKKADQDAQIEQQLNDKIANTKDKARRKENQKQKEIFEAEKANQIANVWIQTAIGIVGAWAQSIAQLGPIAGAIFAGVLTALMLGVAVAQTVVIGQQQFVPAFQTGGTVPGGPAIINEQGGELVTLPDGSVVIPHDISMQIAQSAGGGTKQIVINNSFAGAMISSDMSLRKITNAVNKELGKTLRNQL
jgi:hypothetical protein